MSQLTLEIDFLTGRCVAASQSHREIPEWPPHPGRIFMAMAAACFEHDEPSDQVAALQWLETLPPPRIAASEGCERSAITCYVPVNDKNLATGGTLQSAPGLPRSRQDRHFPTFIPDDPVLQLKWDLTEASGAGELANHVEALQEICMQVIRIGHSSSLVRMNALLTSEAKEESNAQSHAQSALFGPTDWHPVERGLGTSMRIATAGDYQRMKDDFGADQIDLFADLADRCANEKGKAKALAKTEFEKHFGMKYKHSLRPPEPTRPTIRSTVSYQRESAPDVVTENRLYDSSLVILSQFDGPRLDITRAATVAQRLRQAAMSACGKAGLEIPEWLSGHKPGAVPSPPTNDPHVAFLPLPYAGYRHATGHLMGLAMAIPRHVDLAERGKHLGPLLLDDNDHPDKVTLSMGALGTAEFQLEERTSPPQSLENATWVGPSKYWSTVTPVVLDRYPKTNPRTRQKAWRKEVTNILLESCLRSGLPVPDCIDFHASAWLSGISNAMVRTQRKHGRTSRREAEGFPPLPQKAKGGTKGGVRPQVHVSLEFDQPVEGPLFIGAGRFTGYGFFKPVSARSKKTSRGTQNR